jgi:hypothetical protein
VILAWDTAALCSLVGMRDYGLAHVVLPSCKARLQSYRASVGQKTACLVVGHRGAGFMYAVRQRERVVPRRYPIFLALLSSQTISARQQGGKGRDCSKVVCRKNGSVPAAPPPHPPPPPRSEWVSKQVQRMCIGPAKKFLLTVCLFPDLYCC